MYKKKGRKQLKPNKEVFEMMYYNESTSAKELAEIWKVKPQTIYNWASEYRNGNIR